MRFEFMKNHAHEFSIEKMAQILGISRAGYYDFLKRKPSNIALENQRLTGEIKKIHKESRGIYGSPRIHKELKNKEEKCSRKRVAKLMRKEKIQSKIRKKWKTRKRKDDNLIMAVPNHLNQNFLVETLNKVWASDITYIPTQEGWLYVAVVVDLFSRKIVGLSMGETLHTSLVINALNQALVHRDVNVDLMHHSDRGSQYRSKEFSEFCNKHGIKLSMSAKGHCYDNAVVESFFHTLKTELTHQCKYQIREEAKNSIFEYIEVFYNRKRLHSTIGYLSPVDFENNWTNKVKYAV